MRDGSSGRNVAMKRERFRKYALSAAMVVGLAVMMAQAETNARAQVGESNAVAEISTTNVLDKLLNDFTVRAEALSTRYSWARARLMGVQVWQILWSVGVIFAAIMLAQLAGYLMHTRLARALARNNLPHGEQVVAAVQQPLQGVIYVGGVMGVSAIMSLGREATWRVVDKGCKALLGVMCLWLIMRVIDVITNAWIAKAQTTSTKLDEHLIVMGRKTAKIIAIVLLGIIVLDTLDIDVTALVAGLGLGGLAVALALQDTLANFFSSIFIMVDRPFKVGDRIATENVDGVVEEIGFRSTRIRTLTKTQVTIPNKTLANASVDNITRMHKRRVTQTIGVTYETTADQMEQVLEALRAVLRDDPGVDKDFVIVRFHDFGESSLNINVVYFTTMADYQEYLAVRERVNLQFMRALAKLGVAIAFPTRTVYFEGEVARRMAEK